MSATAPVPSSGYTDADGDLRAIAVAIPTMELGPIVLHRLIRETLDPDAPSTYSLGRVGLATLALINPDLQPAQTRADQAAAYRTLMDAKDASPNRP